MAGGWINLRIHWLRFTVTIYRQEMRSGEVRWTNLFSTLCVFISPAASIILIEKHVTVWPRMHVIRTNRLP